MSVDLVISRISAIRQQIDTLDTAFQSAGGVLGYAETHQASSTSNGSVAQQEAVTAALRAAGVTSATGGNSAAGSQFSQLLEGLSGTGAASGTNNVALGGQTESAVGKKIVDAAATWIGVPYQWGGNSRKGVDCSGLVQNVLAQFGIDMPRVARQQMLEGEPVASLDQAQPGDLVVFKNGKHIGIYAGDGKMIDAPKPGDSVRLRDVYETPTAIRRVTGLAPTAAASQWVSTGVVSGGVGTDSLNRALLEAAQLSTMQSGVLGRSAFDLWSDSSMGGGDL